LAGSAGLEPRLATVTVTYVLVLAVVGPIVSRVVEPLAKRAMQGQSAMGPQPSPVFDAQKGNSDDAPPA
jgi:hypothetical protein